VQKIHKFEKAGLGLAPYRYLGMEEKIYQACNGAPVQPGSSCDYCGTAIRYCFWLLSKDGKRFKVGSECILKSGDAGLRKVVTAEQAKKNKEKYRANAPKRLAKSQAVSKRLQEILETRKEEFSAQPHPNDYFAGKGKTYYDYLTFAVQSCGASGKARWLKSLEK
jgi:hypothetical protein